jgi:hypothetical protein
MDEVEAEASMEAPCDDWHTDRSRYMSGFDCSWQRLLAYHAFGTGLSPNVEALALSVGINVHETLEKMLNLRMRQGEARESAIDAPTVDNMLGAGFAPDAEASDDEFLKDARDITIAIPHAYARIVVPWLDDNFDIQDVEKEMSQKLRKISRYPPGPQPEAQPGRPHLKEWRRIVFNSRPDFIALDKATERLTVHDFKTASSFQEAREVMTYADNVQMMINSQQVKEAEGLSYFPDYYVHILVKGNQWSPSPLIHAFHREGAPPMQEEDWQPRYWLDPAVPGGKKRSIGRAYTKTRVSDKRPIAEWVWEMPAEECAKTIIILGPFNVVSEKTQQFLRGLPTNEEEWFRRLGEVEDWTQWADSDFQMRLDRHFPRTFNCYHYGNRCRFYNLCFKGPGWDKPFENGFVEREPHHPQEPKGVLIR